MANIDDILTKILSSRYGKDVRQSIHDGIQMCYDDMEDYNEYPRIVNEYLNKVNNSLQYILNSSTVNGVNIPLSEIMSGYIITSNGVIINYPSSLNYRLLKYDVSSYIGSVLYIKSSTRYKNSIFAIQNSENQNIYFKSSGEDNFKMFFNYPIYIPENSKWLYISESNTPSASNAKIISSIELENKYMEFYHINKKKKYQLPLTLYSKYILQQDGSTSYNESFSSDYKVSNYINVIGLDKLLLSVSSTYENIGAIFYDLNFNIIEKICPGSGTSTPNIYNEKEIEVPSDAAYLIVSGSPNGGEVKVIKYVPDVGEGGSGSPYDLAITPRSVKKGYIIVGTTGTLKYVGDTNDSYNVNEYEVSELPSTFYITAGANWGNAIYAWYDENDSLISLKRSENTVKGTNIFNEKIEIPPSNAKTLRVGNNTSGTAFIYLTSYPIVYSGKWDTKKWIVFGDSLTEYNARTTKHYFDYIRDKTGINISNFGLSGTGYMRRHDEGNAFYQRVEDIDEDFDVITIFGSGNDLSLISSLGNPDDTETNTICGCINTTIDKLFEKYPLANLGIVTPTPWDTSRSSDTMEQYSNAIVEICKNRGIPCLDLYHCSGLRPWEETFRELAYSKDNGGGTHPDETGHAIIAPRFEAFLDSLLLH